MCIREIGCLIPSDVSTSVHREVRASVAENISADVLSKTRNGGVPAELYPLPEYQCSQCSLFVIKEGNVLAVLENYAGSSSLTCGLGDFWELLFFSFEETSFLFQRNLKPQRNCSNPQNFQAKLRANPVPRPAWSWFSAKSQPMQR